MSDRIMEKRRRVVLAILLVGALLVLLSLLHKSEKASRGVVKPAAAKFSGATAKASGHAENVSPKTSDSVAPSRPTDGVAAVSLALAANNFTAQTSGSTVRGQPEPATPPVAANAEDHPDNEAGTLRMYAAHISLRTSSVMDPDSEENRKILGSMVQKALRKAQADTLPRQP